MADDVARLVQRARQGDLEAYGTLVSRFQDAVYGAALARLGNWHDVEEAAQDAFLEAWRKLGDLREPGKFPGWLRRITISCCSRLLRRASRAADLGGADETPSRGTSPVAQAERRELKDRVLEALKSLSEPLREATTLFYINGYSHREVSRFLDVPLGTVKRRLHDSREQLKETMMTLAEDELKAHRPSEEFTDAVIRLATSENDLRVAAKYLTYSARGPATGCTQRRVIQRRFSRRPYGLWRSRRRQDAEQAHSQSVCFYYRALVVLRVSGPLRLPCLYRAPPRPGAT